MFAVYDNCTEGSAIISQGTNAEGQVFLIVLGRNPPQQIVRRGDHCCSYHFQGFADRRKSSTLFSALLPFVSSNRDSMSPLNSPDVKIPIGEPVSRVSSTRYCILVDFT